MQKNAINNIRKKNQPGSNRAEKKGPDVMKSISDKAAKSNIKSSSLLFDEQPLVILPKLAEAIGLTKAVFLQQVHYWLNINEKADKNFRDGRYWTYNTFEQWQQQMPFFSVITLKRIVKELKENNILITGHFNKKGYDRTTWYSINYEQLEAIKEVINSKVSNCHHAKYQIDTMDSNKMIPPIPETNTETTKDLKEGRPKNPAAPAPEEPSPILKEEKPRAEAKDPGSEVGQALGFYRDQFELRTNRQPDIKDKDAAALKKVIKKYGLKDTKTMLQMFFKDQDPFYKKAGYPLLTFCSQINRFLTKLDSSSDDEPKSWNNIRSWLNESEAEGPQEADQGPDNEHEYYRRPQAAEEKKKAAEFDPGKYDPETNTYYSGVVEKQAVTV